MFQTILSSLAIASAGLCILALLLKREGGTALPALVSALAATAALDLFDLLAIIHPEDLFWWKRFSLGAEGVLIFSWVFFSAVYARREGFRSLPVRQKIFLAAATFMPVVAFSFPVSSFFYSPDFAKERMLFLGNNAFFFYIAIQVLLVIAMINLESVLRNAPREARWRMKIELMGVCVLLAALVIYYSQGLLYRSINMNLIPLRSAALITAAGMIVYSRLWRSSGKEAYVSHQMAFRSVVLLAVGLYLVGLGLLGEGMRYFGDSFQRSLLMGIGFFAGVGLLIVLLSETVKRKIQVSLHKNFYRQKYDYRSQWLQFTDRIASAKSGDDLLHSLVLGFCETFGMGGGVLFLRDGDEGTYLPSASLEMSAHDFRFRNESKLLTRIGEKKWVVTIPDEIPDVDGDEGTFLSSHGILFAVPLFHNELLEGFLLLGRPLSSGELYHYEDFDLMKTLARQASSAILNLRLSDELSQARELEAVGKISAFILHDLKNLISTLALVVDNAREHMDNPEFQEDMLQSLEGTVARMRGLIARLKKLEEKLELKPEPVDLLTLAGTVAKQLENGHVTVSGHEAVALADPEEMCKVLLNLLLNAREASGGTGGVTVDVGCDKSAWFRITDHGCGMSGEFLRTRLFKPFSTTKDKVLGIGLYQCRQIVKAHGGQIDVQSEVGKGSTFTVR
ncbi:MAG: PEP-CTERM system histidine kinase PrsK, partial [Geobacteraceae bacterium]|nr:PEP-CTERM system histidine kinase PrsK [Geobacteraceae bacterium]